LREEFIKLLQTPLNNNDISMVDSRASEDKRTWADPSIFLKHIHVQESCLQHPYTQAILKKSNLPFSVISEKNDSPIVSGEYPDNLNEGKRHLLLCENKGNFFKPCPATREYRCCDYQVLNIGMNCPMDCVYCILQAYLNNPYLSFFVNIDKMLQELKQGLQARPDDFFRIGTGEFTDSMALDRLTGLSRILVEFMAEQKKAVLELKTKSAVIGNLKDLNHNGKTIVSWSVNSPVIMEREELRVATLSERLAAASQCAKWGYLLAFHFDPIIDHPGWRQGYQETIDQLFKTVPAESIVYISMGAFRYLPRLKIIGSSRFSGSNIYYQEFIEGLDGKARYFRSRRVELYKHIYRLLKEKVSNNCSIYFCMESDEIWQEVMGFVPEEKGGLQSMLDKSVTSRF